MGKEQETVRELQLLWPWALGLLVALPLLALLYRQLTEGQSQTHSLYPGASLLARAAKRARSGRQLPALIYLGVLVFALFALARPTARVMVPENLSGVMLAIETSRSMAAPDIEPTRLAATQEAAKTLIDGLPNSVKVGLVTFSGYGALNAPLTLEHAEVKAAIERLSLGGDYAFSHGLIASLAALPDVTDEKTRPGAIVLYSHGHDNTLNDPLVLADEALTRGIIIHTVGVGTHGNNFSDDILKLVAERTGGRYYPIFSAADLQDAHRDLSRVIGLRPARAEVSGLASLTAALLLCLSLGLARLRRQVA